MGKGKWWKKHRGTGNGKGFGAQANLYSPNYYTEATAIAADDGPAHGGNSDCDGQGHNGKGKGVSYRAKPCHDTIVNIFSHNECNVYVGRASDIRTHTDWAMAIYLSDKDRSWAEDNSPIPHLEHYHVDTELLAKVLTPKVAPFLNITWPDFGTPSLDRQWWLDLYEALGKIKGDVAIGCTGGHGRTGTAASILWGIHDTTLPNPVLSLRKAYCHHVVETEEQVEYIEDCLDRKLVGQTIGYKDALWAKNRKGPATVSHKDLVDQIQEMNGNTAGVRDANDHAIGPVAGVDYEPETAALGDDDGDDVLVDDEWDDYEEVWPSEGKLYRQTFNEAGDLVWVESR